MVAQLTRLSNAQSICEGTGLKFTVETDEGEAELAIPAADLGNVLQFFASALVHFADDPHGEPTNDLVPIPVSGIAFQAGVTPGTQLMVVNIGGYGLALEMENSVLANMGERMSRTARALAADDQRKPN